MRSRRRFARRARAASEACAPRTPHPRHDGARHVRPPADGGGLRMPCGCDAAGLAARMGMSVEELMRAHERGLDPDYAGDEPVLLTIPQPSTPGAASFPESPFGHGGTRGRSEPTDAPHAPHAPDAPDAPDAPGASPILN